MTLILQPVTFREACAFTARHHRHHKPPRGHKLSIGVAVSGKLCGVAIVGRPVARLADDGFTAEITRLCTDGTPNACSILYGASARAAKAIGYRKIITYILASESGASLRASGYTKDLTSKGGSWSRRGRQREDNHPTEPKTRWSRQLSVLAQDTGIFG